MKNLMCSVLLPLTALAQTTLTTARIAKKVSPSVVVIQGKTDAGDVLGSGFIVSKDGSIVTNLHVIRDMKTASVQLANGDIFDSVSVLATDERRDLAILRVAGFNLPVLDLGNSEAATVGEPVVIVGSPRGLEGTVTAGILSAARDSGDGFKVLQTDAGVNPGNSGGPLLNSKAQVIGVISFKLRSSENLNFAIPINYVRGLLNNIQEPITLEQMRRTLSTASEGNGLSTQASLTETVAWMTQHIPFYQINYQRRIYLAPQMFGFSITEQPTVPNFDGCTASLGRAITVTVPDHSDAPNPLINATVRYTIPLGLLNEGYVIKSENVWAGLLSGMPDEPCSRCAKEEFVDGTKLSYRLILTGHAKAIQITTKTSDGNGDGELTSDRFYLKFDEEKTANSARQAFLHAASLCHNSNVNMPNPKTQDSGPSLQETFVWLKEKIPLATVAYTWNHKAHQYPASEQGTVWSLDSCTATFGKVSTVRFDFAGTVSYTQRFVVPLGILTGNFVERRTKIDTVPDAIPNAGQTWGYRVVLRSKSKEISRTTSTSGDGSQTPPGVLGVVSTDWLDFDFPDEALAQRVLQAFNHVAALCRVKETF